MNDLIVVGEVMAKLAVNFWPVLAFIAVAMVSGWVISRMEGKK